MMIIYKKKLNESIEDIIDYFGIYKYQNTNKLFKVKLPFCFHFFCSVFVI